MKNEMLRIFDDNNQLIGQASRAEVHRLGYWHETFHCWFISHEAAKDYIYLQLRSLDKEDYPDLFDITAAGHLLADETVGDGIREVEEELGVKVKREELISIGKIHYQAYKEEFIDKEIAHVFIYETPYKISDYQLQLEEVAGIVCVDFNHFYNFCFGKTNSFLAEGFICQGGVKSIFKDDITYNSLVPHELSFYQQVVERIKQYLNRR
ncbi:NUDIX hydrolase [Priestia flexa]|uniref:NUDIX hydrolase n=1 Tax=Priestia flexa TaxID=86664 RepID=UPI0021FC5C47|nr:NUDIX domain-containing protein [Bacillus sp. 1780r2a1]